MAETTLTYAKWFHLRTRLPLHSTSRVSSGFATAFLGEPLLNRVPLPSDEVLLFLP